MEDPIPNRHSSVFLSLPWCQSDCLRRMARVPVRTIITGNVVANSFQRSSGFTQIVIHLRALSDGEHHPVAQSPTIQYSRADLPSFFLRSVSITSSRLAMLVNLKRGRVLVIWDWKSAQLLFVCQFLRSYSGEISSTCLGAGSGALQLSRVHR